MGGDGLTVDWVRHGQVLPGDGQAELSIRKISMD
jgi:hypothetical protein